MIEFGYQDDEDDKLPIEVIRNDRTIRAAALVKKLYEFPEGGVGGHCHIVTDDYNLEDENIDFCLGELHPDRQRDYDFLDPMNNPGMIEIERELLTLMRAMNMEERKSVLAIRDEYR